MISAADRFERCLSDVSYWMFANRLKLNADETELLWAGSKHTSAVLGSKSPPLCLGDETVSQSDHIWVIGVTFSSDLSLDKHVSSVTAKCFYSLRQLQRVQRSLAIDSLKTLVHAFIMSLVDYYSNIVLAGSSQYITDMLQRVLNAAACLISGTQKFNHGLSRLLRDELQRLSVPERAPYKLAVTVYRCLQEKAPKYLFNHCTPVSDVASRWHLRSASRHFLTVPRFWRSRFGRRAFTVGDPMAWNSLLNNLRDPPLCISSFRRRLKTELFTRY